MRTLIINDVDDDLHARLTARATLHSRSMEDEVRALLRQAVSDAPAAVPQKFGQAMRAIFEPLGGLELPDTRDRTFRAPPDFSGPEWDSPA